MTDEDGRLIAYYERGVLSGIRFYFWEKDENYAQKAGMLIKGHCSTIAAALWGYLSGRLPGAELLVGMPAQTRKRFSV